MYAVRVSARLNKSFKMGEEPNTQRGISGLTLVIYSYYVYGHDL